MGKTIAYLIILIMVALSFLPMSKYYNTKLHRKEIEQNLNLSCRTLKTSIKSDFIDIKNLGKNSEISEVIDKDLLLESFFSILKSNYPNVDRYNDIVSSIKLKVLIEKDKFYYSGNDNKWSIPVFYSIYNESLGTEIYLNIEDEIVYYFINGKKYTTTASLGMDNNRKTKIIIDKINNIIIRNSVNSIQTRNEMQEYGVKINIKNPYNIDPGEISKSKHFNILEGVTFIAIYSAGERFSSRNDEYIFKNMGVSGYTIKRK